jgi:LysR family transcriptional regulator for bpeEF and oprC
MDRFRTLEVFVRVVETGGFTRAADSMRMPRSTVSMLIRDLEDRIGTRLLHRTTRRMSLTLDGKAYYERCRRVLVDLEEADSLFRQKGGAPRGKMKIDVPSRIGRRLIAPALPDFFAHYPEIELEMGVTDRPIDLIAEAVDAVIRVDPLIDSDLIARQLGRLSQVTCASPAYLECYGAPLSLEQLGGHLAVAYASPLHGRLDDLAFSVDHKFRSVRLSARVTVNNAEAYIACCLAGLGLIQVPAYDVRHHLDAGTLREVLPGHRPPSVPIAVLYPERRHLSRRLRAFTSWAEALFRARMEFEN